MESPFQTHLVNRLAEITNDSIVQSACPLAVVGLPSNEDRGNGAPHINKVSVELNGGHNSARLCGCLLLKLQIGRGSGPCQTRITELTWLLRAASRSFVY